MVSLPPDPTSPETTGGAARPDDRLDDGPRDVPGDVLDDDAAWTTAATARLDDDAAWTTAATARLADDPDEPERPHEPDDPDEQAWPRGVPSWLDEAPARPVEPDPVPLPRDVSRRSRRRKWRRRRRALGVLAFLVVLGGLGYVVATAAGVGDEEEQAASTTVTTEAPTTTLPPAGPYRVLDGLNARAGPGPAFAAVGTIEIGHTLLVSCVADGTLVNGPNGQSTKWLRVPTPLGDIYVTAAYVAVGADLTNPEKIPPCAP